MNNKRKNKNSAGCRIFLAGMVLTVFSGLGACTYDTIKYTPVETPTVVSFSNDIIPVFESGCALSGCHASGNIPPDLSAVNAYNSLMLGGYVETDTTMAEQSIIYQKITTGSMAKYATDQDRALILKWIEQGAQNN